jgi:hypothetical protein
VGEEAIQIHNRVIVFSRSWGGSCVVALTVVNMTQLAHARAAAVGGCKLHSNCALNLGCFHKYTSAEYVGRLMVLHAIAKVLHLPLSANIT